MPFVHDEREITVSPNRTDGFADAADLSEAISYVRTRSSLTRPYTVRLLPGIYTSDDTIDATGLTGVRFRGSGKDATIIGATKAWAESHRTGGATVQGFFDVSSANNVSFVGLTVHGTYGDDGTLTVGQSNALSGILHDTMVGNVLIDDCDVFGFEYAVSAGTNTSPQRIDIMNSRLFGNSNCVRSGVEKWHIFSCDLRATKTDTGPSQTTFASGLQFIGTGEFQVWGCHIHAEDRRTASGDPSGGPVAAVRFPQQAGTLAQILGSTIHVMVGTNPGLANNRFAAVDVNNNVASTLFLIGCDLIYESTTLTQGCIGGISMNTTSASSSNIRLAGCMIRDNGGSGGTQRGWLVRPGASLISSGPNIDISGVRYYDGMVVPTNQITLTGNPAFQPNGTTTLASGTKIILLLTDSGNVGGATDTDFAASVTVTVPDSSLYKAGQYIKAASHADTAWTRIKNIPNSTTLTLEETYRGGALVDTQAKLGVANANTQIDGTYRVLPTLTTAVNETLSISSKHATGFVITSSNGASTATLDWVLMR